LIEPGTSNITSKPTIPSGVNSEQFRDISREETLDAGGSRQFVAVWFSRGLEPNR
jgi:hypothetical protein